MKWRRIRRWLWFCGGALVVVLLIAVWFVGGALVAPANRGVGAPPSGFPATTVEIASESGARLVAWRLDVIDADTTVILLHPIRGDRRSMLSRAKLLREVGYSTLLVDLQAHGESKGRNITVGYRERHDVLAAVEYVREQKPDDRIAIIGRSLGGAATLLADAKVDLVVLESVYPTVSEAVHNRVAMRLGVLHHVVSPLLLMQLKPRLGMSAQSLRPIDHLKRLDCPVLIATGNQDKHTTMEETERMFDVAKEPKRLVVFEGAGHVDLLAFDPEKYVREVVGFLNEVMGVGR